MESLCDPLKDRMVKQVRAPPHRPLESKLMFPDKFKRIFKINERKFLNPFFNFR